MPYFVIGMFDVAVCTALALVVVQSSISREPGDAVPLFCDVSDCRSLAGLLHFGYRQEPTCRQPDRIDRHFSAGVSACRDFCFAIEQMPTVIQYITRVLPARYYVSALKKIFLKGTPTTMLYGELIPLTIFTVLLATVATRAFHKRLV